MHTLSTEDRPGRQAGGSSSSSSRQLKTTFHRLCSNYTRHNLAVGSEEYAGLPDCIIQILFATFCSPPCLPCVYNYNNVQLNIVVSWETGTLAEEEEREEKMKKKHVANLQLVARPSIFPLIFERQMSY
jgi:hypothetical protein